MDASINISMEPFRAFVADLLPAQQHTRGYAVQSLFIGLGTIVASALPWMMANWFHISSTAGHAHAIPVTIQYSFYIGSAALFGAVLWTVISTKEYPPPDMDAFMRMKSEKSGLIANAEEVLHAIGKMPHTMRQLAWVQIFTWLGLFCMWLYFGVAIARSVFHGEPMPQPTAEELAILNSPKVKPAREFANRVGSEFEKNRISTSVANGSAAGDDRRIPPVGKIAEAVHLAGTAAASYSSVLPFTNAVVSEFVAASLLDPKHGMVSSFPLSEAKELELARSLSAALDKSNLYSEGTNWGGLCFSMYSVVTFAFSFLLVGLSQKFKRQTIHTACLICGAVGLLSVAVIHDKYLLLLSMTGVGIAWASILSMPYAILAGSLPPERTGVYMGIFNFFIVLPEIGTALGFGWVMSHMLHNNRLAAVVAGGVFMLLAAILTLRIKDAPPAETPSSSQPVNQ